MLRSAPRSVPISWRRERETLRHADTRNRSCTTRAFTLSRPTESHIGCGGKSGMASGRAPPESHLGGVWRRRPSGGSDWLRDIHRPRHRASSSARPRSWKTTYRCCMKSRWAERAKRSGDRHPKVRRGVLIGAGAKILGNIEIGIGAKVAACSVVLRDVPPHTTVAGIPARVVGKCPLPSRRWKWTPRFHFWIVERVFNCGMMDQHQRAGVEGHFFRRHRSLRPTSTSCRPAWVGAIATPPAANGIRAASPFESRPQLALLMSQNVCGLRSTEREPRALDLDHDAVTAAERVEDVGQRPIDGRRPCRA